MNMEELLINLFDTTYSLMHHKLLLVESSHLLFNSDKELGDAIGQSLEGKTASLKRAYNKIYVLSDKSLERNEILVTLPPKKYALKLNDDDTVTLKTKDGKNVPKPTAEDLLDNLQDKLKGFNKAYTTLSKIADDDYCLDLDKVLERYQHSWEVLKETDKNDDDYKEFNKMLRYHKDELFSLLWDYHVFDEIPADYHLRRFFSKAGAPAFTFLILLGLLPRPSKNEGKEVDNRASFATLFDFLDKYTKDNSPYKKLPNLEQYQKDFKEGRLECTRMNLIAIFSEVYGFYKDLQTSENVGDLTQDIYEDSAKCTAKYDFENVWTDNVSSAKWTIQSVLNGYILNKVTYYPEAKREQWTVLPQFDDNGRMSFLVISSESTIQFLKTGKYENKKICSYNVEIDDDDTFLLKSGRRVVKKFNLIKANPDEEDLLGIKQLKLYWKPNSIKFKDMPLQVDSDELAKLAKQWDAIPVLDLGYSLNFQRLMFESMRYVYVGAYERNKDVKGFPYYYQIDKLEGPLANAAFKATVNETMVYVYRLYDDNGKTYHDYIDFDMAQKSIPAPDTSEDTGIGVRMTTKEETEALNRMMGNEGDGRTIEEETRNPFNFNNKGELDE